MCGNTHSNFKWRKSVVFHRESRIVICFESTIDLAPVFPLSINPLSPHRQEKLFVPSQSCPLHTTTRQRVIDLLTSERYSVNRSVYR